MMSCFFFSWCICSLFIALIHLLEVLFHSSTDTICLLYTSLTKSDKRGVGSVREPAPAMPPSSDEFDYSYFSLHSRGNETCPCKHRDGRFAQLAKLNINQGRFSQPSMYVPKTQPLLSSPPTYSLLFHFPSDIVKSMYKSGQCRTNTRVPFWVHVTRMLTK